MTAEEGERDRKVIPRWRPWRLARALGETMPAVSAVSPFAPLPDIRAGAADWRAKGGNMRAAELVSSALTSQADSHDTAKAASDLLSSKRATPLQREAAAELLSAKGSDGDLLSSAILANSVDVDVVRSRIAVLRRRLVERPRNALTWTDLAREYLVVGQDDRAHRALRNALAIAPNNRFVVRSAVFFYHHTKDSARAVATLQKATFERDPWLFAARVTMQQPKTAVSTRLARQALENFDSAPWHLGELAAAIATREIEGGRDKLAKKFMRTALIDPTENVLAQAEWAKLYGVDSDSNLELIRAPYEAMARRAANERRWKDAADSGLKWLIDQPFSLDAAGFASVYALECENFRLAEQVSSVGLSANPAHPGLLNNRAFARASAWNLNDAARDLASIDFRGASTRERGYILATSGFVVYRGGDEKRGREYYESAIKLFINLGLNDPAARAAVNLAAEDRRVGSDNADSSWKRAKQLVDQSQDGVVREAWRRLCMSEHPSWLGQVGAERGLDMGIRLPPLQG
jgi:tetratricopeptide (TPR) repeat protein